MLCRMRANFQPPHHIHDKLFGDAGEYSTEIGPPLTDCCVQQASGLRLL
jgi:hypothetical protein